MVRTFCACLHRQRNGWSRIEVFDKILLERLQFFSLAVFSFVHPIDHDNSYSCEFLACCFYGLLCTLMLARTHTISIYA
jgi:hypothetical protein